MAGQMEGRMEGKREIVIRDDVWFVIRYLDPDFHRKRLISAILRAALVLAAAVSVVGVLLYMRGL